MSDHDYYQAHVYIEGRKLNESSELDGLTPIADLKIKWGASDWWSPVEPSTLEAIIIDPHGELLNAEPGSEIVITRDPDNTVVFRGKLESSSARFGYGTNRHGSRVPRWEVQINAFDALGSLAADRKHGPTYLPRNGSFNALHWGRQTIGERFTDLNTRSPIPIAWSHTTETRLMDEYVEANPGDAYPTSPYSEQQNVSVLEVLRKSARIFYPMNRPYVAHSMTSIGLFRPTQQMAASHINFGFESGVGLVRTGPINLEVDASHLQVESGGISVDLRTVEAFNYMTLKQRSEFLKPADTEAGYFGQHYEVEDIFGSPTVAITDKFGSSTLEMETDLNGRWDPDINWSNGPVAIMRSPHGWRAPVTFSFSPGKTEAADRDLEVYYFLRAEPASFSAIMAAFTFVNTPLQWGGTIPSFSIVGGELRYTARHGWKATMNPAPIYTDPRDRPADGLTLGDVAGIPDQTAAGMPISAAQTNLTVADFQLL